MLADIDLDVVRLQRGAELQASGFAVNRMQQQHENERNDARDHEHSEEDDYHSLHVHQTYTTLEHEAEHEALREELITHYRHAHGKGEILWLKTAAECRPPARRLFDDWKRGNRMAPLLAESHRKHGIHLPCQLAPC
eukprot:2545892-Pleurochrysis_carterae.AAC.3